MDMTESASAFSTARHTATEVEKPWAAGDQVIGTGSSQQPGFGRRRRQQAEVLTAGRAEILQGYLATQLNHLSGDVAETFEASILGISPDKKVDGSVTQAASPTRRRKRAPCRKSRGPILYPEKGSSVPIGAYSPNDTSSSFGPRTLTETMTAGDAVVALESALSLTSNFNASVVQPRSMRKASSLTRKSNGSIPWCSDPLAPLPQVYDRWPASSSGQRHDDLSALNSSYEPQPFSPQTSPVPGDRRAGLPISPPPPLVTEGGVLFEAKSNVRNVVTRPRERDSEALRSQSVSPVRLRAASVSPAAHSMSSQLQRNVPKLLQDLEYYLLYSLEENGVAGAENIDHPLRGRIVAECFDAYISHCSNYAPLLAKIKAEYEGRNERLYAQLEQVQPGMNRLATLEQSTTDALASQRVTHYRETEGLRAQNEAMKTEKWALEKLIRDQAEQLEANRKRMQKYFDDAEDDFNANAALAMALAYHKKLSHDAEGLYLEKESLAQQVKELQFERDHLRLQLDGVVASVSKQPFPV